MTTFITIAGVSSMTLDQIKEYVSTELNHLNGEYTSKVCLKCGRVFCDPDHRFEDLKLIKMCASCFEEE